MRNHHARPPMHLTLATRQWIAEGQDPLGIEQRRAFAAEMATIRDTAIERWYEQGGNLFLEWVKKYYRRWTGEELNWETYPYLEQVYRLRGCPWIERIMEEKGGQIGFSEYLIALSAFILAEIRVTVAYGFEEQQKMLDLTGPRIQPAFSHIEPIQALLKRYRDSVKREDTDSKIRKITVGAVPFTFFYTRKAADSGKNKSKQQREVPSSMSSFEAWIILADEVEAWAKGALDIARQRQSACTMPTKILRAGSTPGVEGGIVDAHIKSAQNCFQWLVQCPNCGCKQFLHPFGNLLKPVEVENEDGTKEVRYIDIVGRPLDWFCRDRTDLNTRIATAYIGCAQCEQELSWETLKAGVMADNAEREQHTVVVSSAIETGEAFANRVTQERTPIHDWVAIRTPRMVSTLFNAVNAIRDLNTTKNAADTVQQGLGIAVSIGLGKIALSRLMKCVGAPLPDWCKEPDLRVAGVDQGPAAHWLIVTEWYFPPGVTDPEQQWLNAHVRVTRFGTIAGFEELERIMDEQKLDIVGCDHEPEVNEASKFARRHPAKKVKKGKVYLCDQVSLRDGEEWRENTERISQKQKYTVYAIHRTWGLDAVRDRINKRLLYLPAGLEFDRKDPENLLYHCMTSERGSDGRWREPEGEPDHLFHALNFGEVAVHINFFNRKGGGLSFISMG